jgi:hypothetical protein
VVTKEDSRRLLPSLWQAGIGIGERFGEKGVCRPTGPGVDVELCDAAVDGFEPDGVADVVSAMEDELGKIRRREDEACQLWEGKKTKGRGFVSGKKESWGGECLEDDARVA